jgi:hypothetical protein
VESTAEFLLAASHLAIVPLVIEATQVKNTVKHENLYFESGSMPEGAGITRRDFG